MVKLNARLHLTWTSYQNWRHREHSLIILVRIMAQLSCLTFSFYQESQTRGDLLFHQRQRRFPVFLRLFCWGSQRWRIYILATLWFHAFLDRGKILVLTILRNTFFDYLSYQYRKEENQQSSRKQVFLGPTSRQGKRGLSLQESLELNTLAFHRKSKLIHSIQEF